MTGVLPSDRGAIIRTGAARRGAGLGETRRTTRQKNLFRAALTFALAGPVDGGVVLNGSVNVIITDVKAVNGVIHAIDFVPLPPTP